MKKILFLNEAHPILPNQLEAAGLECHFDYTSTATDLMEKIASYQGLVLRSRITVDSTLIDAAPQLEFIAREGVGVEHIDVEYAKQKGIRVLTS
ncbi:MAG: hydroxyacid dehydrogenase, partial [Bacteroidota bacterium]